MIQVLATNITSPLGMTTEENYLAVKSGASVLSTYEHWKGFTDPFASSMFSSEQEAALAVEGCSRFESMVIRSVTEALSHIANFDKDRTVFILSTTKGNVEELAAVAENDGNYLHPGDTAKKIALQLGISTDPIVVCNACISGVSGQLLAKRLIESGQYDSAIVCGADCVTPFTVAGFQSFKALSPYPCRPFDIERLGLNIGEAASTIVLSLAEASASEESSCGGWHLIAGCTNNDAYHVSAPSPVGDGTYRAIQKTLEGVNKENLATVCVHGTATMFNDQMESKAIQQAELSDVPLMALKGYYGHTMGAAGILETVLTLRALDEGCILPTKGFDEIGVSGKVSISSQEQKTGKQSFLKIISGFGGCNGALLFKKGQVDSQSSFGRLSQNETVGQATYKIRHRVHITPDSLIVDEKAVETSAQGKALLTEIYKQHIGNYPKYYKMDMLCRLVFVATEMLLQQEQTVVEGEERGVVLFNRTSSIDSDRKHIATIVEHSLPSPSIFLYTLPNIVTGEIAIKHGYKGETSLYILEEKNEQLMSQIIEATLQQSSEKSLLTGWADSLDEDHFEADIMLVEKKEL